MEFRGNWISGAFVRPTRPQGEWVVRSPSDESDVIGAVQYSYEAIDLSVQAARRAQFAWASLDPHTRMDRLRALCKALREAQPIFVELMGREIGKAQWESDLEVQDSVKAIEAAIEALRDYQCNPSPCVRYRPLGVAAVIGPFNSPLYYSLAHMASALAMGNAVVFKPSEKAPFVAQRLAECFEQAEFPSGVFSLVQGERETGRRLCVHEGIDAVLFTGSYDVGIRIKQDTLQQHWKRLVLETGGKNTLLVCSDADLGAATDAAFQAGFASAGQRCTSTSRILVESRVIDQFVSLLHDKSKAFSIGHPAEGAFMGPLIDRASVDRYMKFLGIAVREGAQLIMRGKALELGRKGHYVSPSIASYPDSGLDSIRRSIFQQAEIFAPCVAVMPFDNWEQALLASNATQFGRVTAIYSADRDRLACAATALECGQIHWNRPTHDLAPGLPALGRRKSGNHFVTGASRLELCSAPLVTLE